MRHPNGYGTVAKLTGNRRRPFVARKTKGFDDRGYPIYDVIGYYPTKQEGLIALAEYNKKPYDIQNRNLTFAELYALWLEKKAHKLGKTNQAALKGAYKNYCKQIHEIKYCDLRSTHMQDVIDKCDKSYATKNAIKNLFYHLDRFALEIDVVEKSYAQLTNAEPIPETSKKPFTQEEIASLWEIKDEIWIDSILVFLYSGWRISELINMKREDIDLDAGIMKGGVKTRSGKGRIVPIHSKIMPFIERRYNLGNEYLFSLGTYKLYGAKYYQIWHEIMSNVKMKHTVHETRHTFRSELDRVGANKVCIDMLMGHKSKDVGERVYTHKTLEELKNTIELVSY